MYLLTALQKVSFCFQLDVPVYFLLLNIWLARSRIQVLFVSFNCRSAPSTPRCSTKSSARDSARTLQEPWRGLSSSSRNAWRVHTLSARLWFTLFSHSSPTLYACVYCFRVMNQILIKTVVWGFEIPFADVVPAFAVFFFHFWFAKCESVLE